jgi:hypothetical protein
MRLALVPLPTASSDEPARALRSSGERQVLGKQRAIAPQPIG